MIELLGAGVFEAEDLAALRVHAGHHVLDGAVFAGGVHPLEDQKKRVAVVGVQDALQRA